MHTPECKRDAALLDLGLPADLLEGVADMPVAGLDIPFQSIDLPDPAEVASLAPRSGDGEEMVRLPPKTGATGRSVRIPIRVPRAVLEGFKARAAIGGVGYQTLMVRALRDCLRAR